MNNIQVSKDLIRIDNDDLLLFVDKHHVIISIKKEGITVRAETKEISIINKNN